MIIDVDCGGLKQGGGMTTGFMIDIGLGDTRQVVGKAFGFDGFEGIEAILEGAAGQQFARIKAQPGFGHGFIHRADHGMIHGRLGADLGEKSLGMSGMVGAEFLDPCLLYTSDAADE